MELKTMGRNARLKESDSTGVTGAQKQRVPTGNYERKTCAMWDLVPFLRVRYKGDLLLFFM